MSITIGTYVQIIPSKVGNTITRQYWQGKTGKVTSLTADGLIAFIDFSGDAGCFHVDKLQVIVAKTYRRKYTNLRIKGTFDQTYVLEDAGKCNGILNGTGEENRYKAVGLPVYFSQNYLTQQIELGRIKVLGVGNAPRFNLPAPEVEPVITHPSLACCEINAVYEVKRIDGKEPWYTHVRRVAVGAWLCVPTRLLAHEKQRKDTCSTQDGDSTWFLFRDYSLAKIDYLYGVGGLIQLVPADVWPAMSSDLENAFTFMIESGEK